MSETEEKVNDDTPRQSKIGPGERLQEARIKKGLSLDDVASRMHLSPSILEAIEDNNFDEITAPIFVKGYLRAYARIVSLGEDEMIDQYVDFYSEEDPPINSTSNMVPELSSTDARIKWTTYFVIVVLGVLLSAWWWNKQQNQEPPVSLDVQSSRTDENAGIEASVDSDIQARSETPVVADENTTVAEPDSAAAAVAATADSAAVNETAAADGAAMNEMAAGEAVEPAVAEAVEPEAAADQASEAPATDAVALPLETDSSSTTDEPALQAITGTRDNPALVAPTGSDKLKIIIHADTWADVKDSNNYQLVYDLLRADSSVELSGKAPFTVFLGNGHGVEIQFNDEDVGFSSSIRDNNTARIEIGG